MQLGGFWQDVFLVAQTIAKPAHHASLAMNHRRVNFLNPHLERSEQKVSRIGAGFSGN